MTKLRNFLNRRLDILYPVLSPLLFFIFVFSSSFDAFAQKQTILSGIVIDGKSHEPLIGSSIRIKGTSKGCGTDLKGEFKLIVEKKLPVTLIISSIGYRNQEIVIFENEPLKISLTEDVNQLSAVVVIGYGTQKREELTGSIASIPNSALKASVVSSFDNALQGRASGVQVTQSSGSPGGAVSVRIRGGNSITGGNEPLYVIDGFPVYNNNNNANSGALNGPSINVLATINPGDIESIDVLKDASATAIYGSRGANGVIIITTKRGKAGVSTVTYDGSYGVQEITKTIDLLNAKEWGILKNDALVNSGKSPQYTQNQLDSLGTHNNDWQAAAFRQAPVQNHQISFTGGSEKTKYSVSLGYLNQQGILIGTDFDRYSCRIGLDSKISDKLNFGVNINSSVSSANIVSYGSGSGGDIVSSILFMPPTVPIKDANGNYTFKSPYESAVANPIATLNEATNQSRIHRVLGSTYAEYQIIPGLKAKVLIGADILANKQNSYTPSTLFEGYSYGGIAAVGTKSTYSWLNENTISYSRTINKDHNFDVLAGFTQQESQTEGVLASSSGFTSDILKFNDLYSGTSPAKPTSSYTSWALQSFLGRVNYSYRQKYFFTASIRADGSSRLGKNSRWGYFPSASIAWQINKESFLEDYKGTISNLKFRLSAGKAGNQEIEPYQSLSLLSTYIYPTLSGTVTGYAPSRIANPDLKWETTTQYDAGLDIGLFNNQQVKIVIDAYYKKTTDLLLNVPIPKTSGYSTSLQNIGSVENKGLEIEINTDNLRGQFTWNTDASISLNRNKVLDLGGQDYFLVASEIQTGSVVKVGQPLGSFWGFKTNGLIRSSDDLSKTLLFAPYSTQKGDVKYVDVNNDKEITEAGDQTIIGNAQPKFIYGIANNFSYRNFDLSIFFQGSYGNKIYSYILQQLQLTTGFQNGISGLSDHWTSTNDGAQYSRANENLPTTPVSDRYVYDGSYLRLKNITFGYSLPKEVVSKLKISKLRLYVSGQNLITWSSYLGFDPEVNYYDQNSSRQGVDASAYPNSKTFLGGVSVTF